VVEVAAVIERVGSRKPDRPFRLGRLSAELLAEVAGMGDMAVLGVTDGREGALTVGLAGT